MTRPKGHWCCVYISYTVVRESLIFSGNVSAGTFPLDEPRSSWLVFVFFMKTLSLLVIQFKSFQWSAVLFMVSSGHVCRQVVGRRSQVQTPTLVTLPVSSSSNTHLLFSFLLSNKTSKISQFSLLLLTPETFFSTIGALVQSWRFPGSLIFSLFSPFFKHIAALSLFDRFLWPQGQHFYVALFPLRENAYSHEKFLLQ